MTENEIEGIGRNLRAKESGGLDQISQRVFEALSFLLWNHLTHLIMQPFRNEVFADLSKTLKILHFSESSSKIGHCCSRSTSQPIFLWTLLEKNLIYLL